MSCIFAADLSLSNTGWAVGEGGRIVKSGLIPGKGEGVARLIHNRDKVCAQIDAIKPDLVVFEDFSFGSNMAFAREIAAMAFMIRAELYADKMPYLCVSPLSVKKYCVGTSGSAKNKVGKDVILKEVYRRFGHDVSSHDEADALILCHLGMALLGDEEPTIDPQREVLAKLRESNKWLNSHMRIAGSEEW